MSVELDRFQTQIEQGYMGETTYSRYMIFLDQGRREVAGSASGVDYA